MYIVCYLFSDSEYVCGPDGISLRGALEAGQSLVNRKACSFIGVHRISFVRASKETCWIVVLLLLVVVVVVVLAEALHPKP